MTDLIAMSLAGFGEAANGYSVQRRGGVTLVFGPVPIGDFVALTKVAGRSAVLSPELADRIGATFAFGPVAAIAALLSVAPPRPVDGAKAEKCGLDEGALEWLRTGEHGTSSIFVFQTATGYRMRDCRQGAYPRDPSDLWRCRALLGTSAVVRAGFAKLAHEGPVWRALVQRWDELCALMDEEAPDRKAGKGSAPNTYALLKEIASVAASGSGTA